MSDDDAQVDQLPNQEATSKSQQQCPLAEEEDWKERSRPRNSRCLLLLLLNAVLLLLLIILLLLWYLRVLPQNIYLEEVKETSRMGCSPLKLPICHKHKVPYSSTLYPNSLGHVDQNEASEALARYELMLTVKCSPLLPLFLCSLFAPKCAPGGIHVPPCKSLCTETVRKCDFFLDVFSVSWPEKMSCDDLPDSPDPDICVGHEQIRVTSQHARACINGFRCDKTRCLPQSWVCDGFTDCTDGADERNCSNCSPDQYYCGHRTCIGKDLVCDGIPDCPDGREERRCLRLSGNESQGGEGRLEAYSLITDTWQPVCGDQWDTTSMSNKVCSMLGFKSAQETRLQAETSPLEHRVIAGITVKRPIKSIFSRSHKGCGGDNVYVYLKCKQFECGRSTIGHQASLRIVGGAESEPGAWPWLVALHGGPDEVFFCGGVLISDWWVLSAAHCVGNQSETVGWTLKLGMTRRPSRLSQRRGVSRIVRHPQFNQGSQYIHDIVLIRLDRPVLFDAFLRPICLPQQGLKLPEACTVIGWGKHKYEDEDYQSSVHQVEVPIVELATCREWYLAQDVPISDPMLCAGFPEGEKDACQGDSGGPLVCQRSDGSWMVGGVVSWGIQCAQPNLPGIYANVPLYVDWIEQTMTQ